MHMSATKTDKKASHTAAKTKQGKKTKTKPAAEVKGMSALSAAAKVLEQKGVAMTCQELIGIMAAKGYWSSPGGKTPAATLYAGIIKEIQTKGKDSRFKKTAPGRFATKDSPVTPADVPESPAKKGRGKKGGRNAKVAAATPVEPFAAESA
jgi:hypothetical protein